MSWKKLEAGHGENRRKRYLDLDVDCTLLIVELLIVVGVHLQVVEGEFLLDSFLECLALLESKRVGLGDHRDDVDDVRQFLEDDDIDRLETKVSKHSQHFSV